MLVVSSDAFQIMTDCWHTRRHSHIITQPQTQALFLSHMYANFLHTFSSPHRHTLRHPCQTVPTAVEIWSTFSRRSPCPQGEIHFKCSWPHWFWKTSQANSCVLFIGEWYDRSNFESTHIACSQGQRRGSDTGWKSSAPKADRGWGCGWIQLFCYYCRGKIALAFHFGNWIQERS